MYQAAEAYGDPTVEGQWGPSSVNPNSALALAALKAQEQTQATQNSLGKNDTLFSSIAGQDYNTIAGTQQRADLAGYQKYQAALAKFNAALAQASTTETSTIGGAQADERQNAINNLPTPDTATGSAAAGTNNAGTTTAGGIKTPKVGKGAKVSTTTKVKVPKASTGKTSVPKVSSRK
jgi:hypothetical protein